MTMPRTGQIWFERDHRFMRYVKVLGFTEEDVVIQTCDHLGVVDKTKPRRKVSGDRFDGRYHNYAYFGES